VPCWRTSAQQIGGLPTVAKQGQRSQFALFRVAGSALIAAACGKQMSNQSENARFVTCPCQHCGGHIEFDANELTEESTIVPCPHCLFETIVFVPPERDVPPVIPNVAKSDPQKAINRLSFIFWTVGLIGIVGLFRFAPTEIAATVTILAIPLFAAACFVFSHFRPLNDNEVSALASKRRSRKINAYYQFSHWEAAVNLEFKKAMAAKGGYYNVNTTLKEFPAIAAGLLKYKKHEWIIIGFEKEQKIDFIWLNKGPDNTEVTSHLSFAGVVNHARSGNHTTVIVLHNHPNPNPGVYSLLGASEQDLRSAKAFEGVLLAASVNLVEFVCERGQFRRYHIAIAPSFIPVPPIFAAIRAENNKSRFRNFELHLERIF
jgi:hypothetical protein